MSWFRWSGESFRLNKDRDGMGMTNDGLVLEGKGDGTPLPQTEVFFRPQKKITNGKDVG